MSELGFLSTSGVWSYHSQTSGPTLTLSATDLLHLRSYLTNSRVRSVHCALWLMNVSIFDQLSSTEHGKSSSAAAWGLCGSRGAAAVGRLWLCSPAPFPDNIPCHPTQRCLRMGYVGCDPESLCLLTPMVCGGMYSSALDALITRFVFLLMLSGKSLSFKSMTAQSREQRRKCWLHCKTLWAVRLIDQLYLSSNTFWKSYWQYVPGLDARWMCNFLSTSSKRMQIE